MQGGLSYERMKETKKHSSLKSLKQAIIINAQIKKNMTAQLIL